MTAQQFEEELANPAPQEYVLCLYVAGSTPKSIRAVENIKRLCEEQMPAGYDLEVIDLYQNPSVAGADQVIAVPTLVKRLPLPFRKMIGDLSNEGYVLRGLGLKKQNSEDPYGAG